MSRTDDLPRRWPGPLQAILSRPNLIAGIVAGVIVYVVAGRWAHEPVARTLAGWDVGVMVFAVLSFILMSDCDHERMKARALAHDDGRHVMLTLALLAAVASIVAIAIELGGAKGHGALHEAVSVGLTIATIVLSWFFVHLVFAIHYAHLYYSADEECGSHEGGLDFPADDAPDYWDFLYFSVVIGSTSQTADVNIQSKIFRRTATVHCLIAFAFNTAILATMINLAAGLFS